MCAVKKNAQVSDWRRRYQVALRKCLALGSGSGRRSASLLGRQAVALGLETLEVARIHEQALATLISMTDSTKTRERAVRRGKSFFAETIIPIERTHRSALKATACVHRLIQTLRQRTAESSASTRRLKRSIIRRQGSEKALKKSGIHRAWLLAQSQRLQKQLQLLTHASLATHEDARRKLSRGLYDDVAQALLGIHVRLLTLKKSAHAGTETVKKEIAETRRLVKESVKRISQFDHEYGGHEKT